MPPRTPLERCPKQQASQQLAAYENEFTQSTASEFFAKATRRSGREAKGRNNSKKARETFLQAKGRLWPDVESLLKRYDELKSNDSVSNALRAYNAQTQAHLKVGPSDDLSKKAKQVISYEQTYSPETAPRPKKMSRHETSGPEEKERQASPGAASNTMRCGT